MRSAVAYLPMSMLCKVGQVWPNLSIPYIVQCTGVNHVTLLPTKVSVFCRQPVFFSHHDFFSKFCYHPSRLTSSTRHYFTPCLYLSFSSNQALSTLPLYFVPSATKIFHLTLLYFHETPSTSSKPPTPVPQFPGRPWVAASMWTPNKLPHVRATTINSRVTKAVARALHQPGPGMAQPLARPREALQVCPKQPRGCTKEWLTSVKQRTGQEGWLDTGRWLPWSLWPGARARVGAGLHHPADPRCA